ncbi:uncharacterized protein LOC132529481 [Lagenorhynchus albirostris]|uniref:uncharacterized protein LOC132529481 n=1 Tax=Lagenorhynchus albirostris TaxID=27610 RepID=UPI0028E4CB4F|nr:uncharacterized protein LOC132529481 [Lagenorhynchus albirostris]
MYNYVDFTQTERKGKSLRAVDMCAVCSLEIKEPQAAILAGASLSLDPHPCWGVSVPRPEACTALLETLCKGTAAISLAFRRISGLGTPPRTQMHAPKLPRPPARGAHPKLFAPLTLPLAPHRLFPCRLQDFGGLHRATRRLTGSQPGQAQLDPGLGSLRCTLGALSPITPCLEKRLGTCPSEAEGAPCLAPASPKGSKHLLPPRQKA